MARSNASNRSASSKASAQRPGQKAGDAREENQSTRNGATRSRSSNRGRSAGGSRRKSSAMLRPENVKAYDYRARNRGAQSIAGRAVETVTDHPVPAILIGAGITWLLMESSGVRNMEKRLLNQGRELLGGVGESLSEYAGTAREALSGAAGYVGESLGSVTERTSRLGDYASDVAGTVGHGLESGYEYTRETLSETFDRHPLAVCAAILTAGVAAGMMLPSTVRENSWMGRTSDALSRNVREKSAELLEQGRNLASSAAESVTRAVGLTGNESASSRSRNRKGGRSNNRSRRSQ
jgi:ElaB/YqjD/DUF883 family membrane-anchored ribosome-binding protein